ncbi:hypothetical protein GL177_04115 [Vibrio toranzoniae]|uniref:hypothetical protein n=1 Tax=Vibrio toranzoniae TaxID=1194427 RepID=UPI0013775295|nr:hypothetical protein [Vibrio toranzoniae]NAZ52544.1 hypothetical protein [Vibrio toranzoniae]
MFTNQSELALNGRMENTPVFNCSNLVHSHCYDMEQSCTFNKQTPQIGFRPLGIAAQKLG